MRSPLLIVLARLEGAGEGAAPWGSCHCALCLTPSCSRQWALALQVRCCITNVEKCGKRLEQVTRWCFTT